MFGESESESPRVPSPWDSLISSSPSPSPGRSHTPSPLAAELIPRLVPESDDGNVEYKLQLLNPSPARFARLVTQMKWRLLEGGGQAYYELGVADSGDLIGLPRQELEQTLETLEMMAGEIGASVIVVKEVEVPAALAKMTKRSGDGSASRRRKRDGLAFLMDDDDETASTCSSSAFTTETEGSRSSDVDFTTDTEDMSSTVTFGVSQYPSNDQSTVSLPIFNMDPDLDTDPADGDDERHSPYPQPRFAVDLEISSVFKPRPVRTPAHNFDSHLLVGGKNKRVKKYKHLPFTVGNKHQHQDHDRQNQDQSQHHKGVHRRQNRDRKREEKRKTLMALAAQTLEDPPPPFPLPATSETLIAEFENIQVHVVEPIPVAILTDTVIVAEPLPIPEVTVVEEVDDDDDVFASPIVVKANFPTFAPSTTGESYFDVDPAVVKLASALGSKSDEDEQPRLIVEALVVRKMSLEEAFLDFGGFSLT